MIQPIGNRLLVQPMYQDAKARELIAVMKSDQRDFVQKLANEFGNTGPITLVTTVPPVAGTVIAIGKPFCDECKQQYGSQILVGDVVVYHKSAGMEVEIDRVPHLVMRPDDVLLIWRPDPVPVKDFTHLEFHMTQEPHGTPA